MAAARELSPIAPASNAWDRFRRARSFLVLARIALTTAYWWGGFDKLFNFSAAVAEVRHFGLEPAHLLAAATIVVEIGGALLIIQGRAAWIGAIVLSLFTAYATVLGHAFWSAAPSDHFREFNSFLEHIGLIGGLLLGAIAGQRQLAERGEEG